MHKQKPPSDSAMKKSSRSLLAWLEAHSAQAGVAAFAFIPVFYFVVITLANSWPHAWQQFLTDWPWILALALGFGLQVRLHLLLRHQMRKRMQAKGMAACAGVSGAAMVACCAHHVSDALPFLGLAGVAGFFYDYRQVFLLFGVLSNLVGIVYLLQKFNELKLDSGTGFVQRAFRGPDAWRVSAVGSAAVFLSYVLRVFVSR